MPARPKPAALDRGQAHRSKEEKADRENQPQVEAVKDSKPPGYVRGAAKKYWKDIAPVLEGVGILADMDTAAVANYCETFNEYIKARDSVERWGQVITTTKGDLKISPYMKLMLDCQDRMMRMLIEFGCTPAARTRVRVLKKKEKERGNAFGNIAAGKLKVVK